MLHCLCTSWGQVGLGIPGPATPGLAFCADCLGPSAGGLPGLRCPGFREPRGVAVSFVGLWPRLLLFFRIALGLNRLLGRSVHHDLPPGVVRVKPDRHVLLIPSLDEIDRAGEHAWWIVPAGVSHKPKASADVHRLRLNRGAALLTRSGQAKGIAVLLRGVSVHHGVER